MYQPVTYWIVLSHCWQYSSWDLGIKLDVDFIKIRFVLFCYEHILQILSANGGRFVQASVFVVIKTKLWSSSGWLYEAMTNVKQINASQKSPLGFQNQRQYLNVSVSSCSDAQICICSSYCKPKTLSSHECQGGSFHRHLDSLLKIMFSLNWRHQNTAILAPLWWESTGWYSSQRASKWKPLP